MTATPVPIVSFGWVSTRAICLRYTFKTSAFAREDCSAWRLAFALKTCAKSIAPLLHWLGVVVLSDAPTRKTGSSRRPKFRHWTAFR